MPTPSSSRSPPTEPIASARSQPSAAQRGDVRSMLDRRRRPVAVEAVALEQDVGVAGEDVDRTELGRDPLAIESLGGLVAEDRVAADQREPGGLRGHRS